MSEQERIKQFIEKLMQYPDVFICGPSFHDAHLRVYAYGGFLSGIPTTSRSKPQRFDPDYIKYADEKQEALYKAFHVLKDVKDVKDKYGNPKKDGNGDPIRKNAYSDHSPKGAGWYDAVEDHLPDLLNLCKIKFTLSREENGESNAGKERNQQNIIARNHTDIGMHNGTVVCDYESCIPKTMYAEGMEKVKAAAKEKLARFDLIALKLPVKDDDHAILSIVEYKCNKAACVQGAATVSAHARDMIVCENIGDKYKMEILRRFAIMSRAEFGLIKTGRPEKLMKTIERLREKPSLVKIQKCFLFTGGDDLTADIVAEICKDQLKGFGPENFLYQYRDDPKDVDLSRMMTWNEFQAEYAPSK